MSRVKLYVGGMRPNHTDSQLRQHFTQYGAVTDCYVVRDSKTDKSRGYAFVTFREEAHAARALADCPQFIEGGLVNVKPFRMKIKKKMDAKDKEDDKVGKEGEDSGTGGKREVDKLSLFVGTLKSSATN